MKQKLIQILQRVSLGLSFVALIVCFLFVILYHQMVHTIPVGHSGVEWHRIAWAYTRTSEGPLSEGVKIIMPWDKLYTYDLRLQTKQQSYQVVSKDGLHFQLTLSFRWRAIRENIVDLNQTLGPDYVEKLLVPEIGSTAREVVAHFSAEDLYTSARATVQKQIYDTTTADSIRNGIVSQFDHEVKEHEDVVALTDILIERIELPEKIKQAIENKLEQAQVAAEFVYRLERERLESQRKLIEAEGIRDFQKTVAPAITESYLRWRGIEATLKLSESGNSKVVVIGNSATGLPLILDTRSVDAQSPPSSSPDQSLGDSKAGSDLRGEAPDQVLPSGNLSTINKKNR
ncbi:MAG: prohibitin family protein [Chromatiales bacterium]|nr:prohibitin family protein [Pseudomonadota bacterium]MBT6277610.1 prohibitin family protein [Chromatiales bacterium]MBT7450834.1 prohibitin family protein [Rhodospirillaceae bacterium]